MTERRQLTVIFSDLVSSTLLSQRLDPEGMSALLGAYHRECTLAIERHGGYVAQYLGDGILAYFGYPNAHEDDARRAVAAALSLVPAVARIQGRSALPSVQVRVGVHTGTAVLGAVGADRSPEQLAIGDIPNLAARVQAAAEPNTVVVSEATQRLVQESFHCQQLSRMIQAADGPIALHRVLSKTGHREPVSRVEDAPQTFGVLWGQWAEHFAAGQLIEARPLAERVVRMAHAADNADLIPPAHNALGFVQCYTAHYEETVALVEQGLSLFELERERKNIARYQFASSIALCNMGATALWMLGKSDQSRALAARARRLAEQLGHPASTAFAIASSTWLLQLAGDAQGVSENAELFTKLPKDDGCELWQPLVRVFAGWAKLASGELERGAEVMLRAFGDYRVMGGGMLRTHGFALLADGLLKADRADEAIATVAEAIANAHATGEVHFEPELHRIRGLALLERARKSGESLGEAQAALQHAVELAHDQKAHWLELRAAIWLARLLHAQGESHRARQLLEPAHARISEGHVQREMVEARTLLAELRSF